MVRVLPALILFGCLPPDASDKPWKDANPGPPEIAFFDLYCDVDAAKWELEVEATAWTGGGNTIWTVDGEYVETHTVSSVQAAADGTEDILKLSLKIVADWREAKSGSATAFRCAEDPNVLFTLLGTGGAPVDCEIAGPNPEIWNVLEDPPQCD